MKSKITYRKIFFVLLSINIIFIALSIIFNKGLIISSFLFHDIYDCGNDFFNSISAAKGYGLGYSCISFYPPLARLFYHIIARIVSGTIDLSITYRNTMFDLRMNQAALFIYLMITILTCIVIVITNFYFNKKKNIIFSASIIFLYSVLFALERGNIILISFSFLLLFLTLYESDNKYLKEAGYVCLAISAGLKYYPAVFGLLLIFDKKWMESARTIIYGLVSLIVPTMIVSRFTVESIESSGNLDITGIANILIKQTFGEVNSSIIFIYITFFLALCILLIYLSFKTSKMWKKTLSLGFLTIMLGVQFSFPYAWMYLIPSFYYFMNEESISWKNSLFFVLMLLINVPFPFFVRANLMILTNLQEIIKLYSIIILITVYILTEIKRIALDKSHE